MQPNFFQWIRDGVKQSVLLGVSDAVDQLGTIPHNEKLNEHLRSALAFDGETGTKSGHVGSGTSGRKRLGRSLKDS